MLLSILSDLLGKTKYSLTRIRKIFPENRPEDGVPKLVALFKLSLESAIQLQSQFRDVFSTRQMAMDFTSNLPKEPLENLLASCVEVTCSSYCWRLLKKIINIQTVATATPEIKLNLKMIYSSQHSAKV